jgi:hypothetical protein
VTGRSNQKQKLEIMRWELRGEDRDWTSLPQPLMIKIDSNQNQIQIRRLEAAVQNKGKDARLKAAATIHD